MPRGRAVGPATPVVVIGDIVESRSLPDRAGVQRRLLEAVDAINAEEAEGLAAALRLTTGDEVQAVLADPAAAVELITRLSDALRPVELAWGLGRGPLTTDWSDDVSAMDGPCFHRARAAVEEAADEGVWLRALGFSAVDDRVLSGLFRLLGVLRAGWTDTQFAYVRALRGATQRQVAERFGRDETTVSRTLSRAHVHDVLEAEGAARALLAAYGGDGAEEAAARARGTVRTT
ncbi:MAG: SatD family protein [Candidatus Palauibacterales bacterium]|nr:SatD family protein [Candidatus Palauibacterales bacterium]MDP2528450.1 SatD family protein [Candidatus Palauibacterales bacterium]MDP2584461.1 SatD family protein [Candidatus Palauibacterales bacterium]